MQTIRMKKVIIFCFLSFFSCSVTAQVGFLFEKKEDKVVIPFQLIHNLIFIPIKVNGVELTFLLDSGVDETILFSMEEKKEVRFSNVEKIALRGLGSEDAVEGLKSQHNTLEILGWKSSNHLIYIILDQNFNLSYPIGIPVNGIIGYSFLQNNLVEINYAKKRITVYKNASDVLDKFEKKFQKMPISIEKRKPYISSKVVVDTAKVDVKLLLDIGNSDAIWLFSNDSNKIKVPEKHFDDYLGKGFSGDIEGKRAKINTFTLSEFNFKNPIVAFPDSTSIRNVNQVKNRSGSIGGEILRRFTVVFDYPNQNVYFRKNANFYAPFDYNKSGIELEHFGLQWVQETVSLETISLTSENKTSNNFKYKFNLKPVYKIAHVRKNSVAAICGLQIEDVLVSINGVSTYKYSLEKINTILQSEEEKWVVLEVERQGELLKFKFLLQNVL